MIVAKKTVMNEPTRQHFGISFKGQQDKDDLVVVDEYDSGKMRSSSVPAEIEDSRTQEMSVEDQVIDPKKPGQDMILSAQPGGGGEVGIEDNEALDYEETSLQVPESALKPNLKNSVQIKNNELSKYRLELEAKRSIVESQSTEVKRLLSELQTKRKFLSEMNTKVSQQKNELEKEKKDLEAREKSVLAMKNQLEAKVREVTGQEAVVMAKSALMLAQTDAKSVDAISALELEVTKEFSDLPEAVKHELGLDTIPSLASQIRSQSHNAIQPAHAHTR
jgi:ribosomal protein L9